MKKSLSRTITVTFLIMLLTSCNKMEANQPLPSVEIPITQIIVASPTPTFVLPTSTPITIGKLNSVCIPNRPIKGWEISPNSRWMTSGFYSDNEEDSLLQVVSLDCEKVWKVTLSKFKEKSSFSDDDIFIPYHWSKDGKFLYTIIGQRFSGCCWKGLRYVLLVSLDMETGEQIPILNTESNSGYIFDFVISDSDRYIIFTSPSEQSFDFAVLDLQTWETQEFFLKFPKQIDVVYAVMSPSADKVILPLFQNIEFDQYFVDSIALIDLTTGEQELLISGLTPEKELYPVRWVDETHVLLSNIDPKFNQDTQVTAQYWLLNIESRELEKQENP